MRNLRQRAEMTKIPLNKNQIARMRRLIARAQTCMRKLDNIHRRTGFRDNEATGLADCILALWNEFPEVRR